MAQTQLPVSISKLCADLEKPAPTAADLLKAKNKDLQKTKLCVYFLQGSCGAGANCRFAHNASEIRSTPNLTKTQLCVKFMNGNCFNASCTYAHGEAELVKPPSFKKKMCAWYKDGRCRNGAKCGFAHSMAELDPGSIEAGPPPTSLSQKPWGKKAFSDDGDASTAVPSSESLVESDISMTGRTGLPEENLFRMMASRGSAPLQHQVASMSAAVGELQAKLANVEDKDQAELQAQVKYMQNTIQHLSKQCQDMESRVHNPPKLPVQNCNLLYTEDKQSPHTTMPQSKGKPGLNRSSKYDDDTNRGSSSTGRNVCHTSVLKPQAKTMGKWTDDYRVRAAMGVLCVAVMAMVELTLSKSM